MVIKKKISHASFHSTSILVCKYFHSTKETVLSSAHNDWLFSNYCTSYLPIRFVQALYVSHWKLCKCSKPPSNAFLQSGTIYLFKTCLPMYSKTNEVVTSFLNKLSLTLNACLIVQHCRSCWYSVKWQHCWTMVIYSVMALSKGWRIVEQDRLSQKMRELSHLKRLNF